MRKRFFSWFPLLEVEQRSHTVLFSPTFSHEYATSFQQVSRLLFPLFPVGIGPVNGDLFVLFVYDGSVLVAVRP